MKNSTTPLFDRLPGWSRGPWIIALLGALLYANTTRNQFALDDGLVLSENNYVTQGFAGIGDILAHDSFHGSIGNSAYLSGGRYRPLSLVTYAMEVSFFGVNAPVHHAVNALLFALCCVVLFRFLARFVFPATPWATWCTTLLFAVHPIHTEVVANIKGRDELLSLIFLLLTLHHALLHQRWLSHQSEPIAESRRQRKERERSGAQEPGRWSHVWSALFFGLALLAKENGLAFVFILPITVYFLSNATLGQAIWRSLPVIALVVLYVGLRVLLLEARNNTVQEVMDNPYLYASTAEKLGTIAYVLLRYIGLLFWPHPLTYDYSFNTIPYRTFGDPLVILSVLLHLSLLAFAVMRWKNKDLLAWCILFQLATLLLVSNLAFNIGAPMAERFLFQASVPFLIGMIELVRRLADRVQRPALNWSLASILLVMTGLSAYATVHRNADWTSGDDLFLHDVAVSPNSVRAQTFAGIALIHRSDEATDPEDKRTLASASLTHFHLADSIHDTYLPTLLNMGLAHQRLGDMEAAIVCWERARKKDPNDGKLKELDKYLHQQFLQEGIAAGMKQEFDTAIVLLHRAAYYDSTNVDVWYNLGGICFTAQRDAEARAAWEHALRLKPDHTEANAGMNALRMRQTQQP